MDDDELAEFVVMYARACADPGISSRCRKRSVFDNAVLTGTLPAFVTLH